MQRSKLALLPSGTASNESLHTEINNFFRQTQHMHQSTLRLKLRCILMAKQLVHSLALYNPTIRQMAASMVLSRVVTRPLWTTRTWAAWCGEAKRHDGLPLKATTPLAAARQREQLAVRQSVMRRPAGSIVHRRPRKRTPLTLKREGSLIVGGVRAATRQRQA